jgi:hypothetical protein
MPHYKLVASGRRPELKADEIVLSRHEDSGEPKHTLSTRRPSEIPEEMLTEASNLAERLGFSVVESEPEEEMQERTEEEQAADQSVDADQPVGADAAGQAPAVSPTGDSGAEIDQQETAAQGTRAAQQNAPNVSAQTTQGGTPATSATTAATPPSTNS